MTKFWMREGWLDRLAIGLSGICLAHCIVTTMVVALLASVGGVLMSPIVHEIGLVLAILIGAVALGRGAMLHGRLLPVAIGSLGIGAMAGALTLPHGGAEILYTICGISLVALGHHLNQKALI